MLKKMMSPMLVALLAAGAVHAAETAGGTMSAQEFDEYTRGKTLFYGENGQSYGAEHYLDNRRVRWSFLDGECKEGTWYEGAGQICFVYEDNPDPQCWTFREEGGGLVARFANLPGATELYEARDINEEMICIGPEVGV